MRNVLIELNDHVANKAAAAVESLTDPSDVAWTLSKQITYLSVKCLMIQKLYEYQERLARIRLLMSLS